jgi:hypothetical protein
LGGHEDEAVFTATESSTMVPWTTSTLEGSAAIMLLLAMMTMINASCPQLIVRSLKSPESTLLRFVPTHNDLHQEGMGITQVTSSLC